MSALFALESSAVELDERLARYVAGMDWDAKGQFQLAADRWDFGAYVERPSDPARYRVGFRRLQSWLRPYVKWYVYERALLAGRGITTIPSLVASVVHADSWLITNRIELVDLGAQDVFKALWDALCDPFDGPAGERPIRTVWRQSVSRPFWKAVAANFGSPKSVPPVQLHRRPSFAILGVDETKLLPPPVIAQLVNRLGLHRDHLNPLDEYDAVRLAVLVLHIALGRRISEVLNAESEPLVRYTAIDGSPALGFRFRVSKNGDDDIVYVSNEWVDLVEYCVETIETSVSVLRPLAPIEDRGRFILVTRRRSSTGGAVGAQLAPPVRLRYATFVGWINGTPLVKGALARWAITPDGEPNGAIYHLRTHSARHTRNTALASDPGVSVLAAARDLNVRGTQMVAIYQHGVAAQNEVLRRRAGAGELRGNGAQWVIALSATGFEAGIPRTLAAEPRLLTLIRESPAFAEFARVPTGYCVRPQGPGACPEFLMCVEATDSGCSWFASDPNDERCLNELDQRAVSRRDAAKDAVNSGRVVLAGKLAVLADRAERFRDEVRDAAPPEALNRLREFVAMEDRP